jgi:type II secretory ATPase GspE/PulE/Tfp pilus assembly ATPase PilB-like protein
LCGECSIPEDEISLQKYNNKLKILEGQLDQKPTYKIRNPAGCNQCSGGIVGRIPILEYANGEGVASYLNGKNGKDCLQSSLKQAAFNLATKGFVELEEVFHVA